MECKKGMCVFPIIFVCQKYGTMKAQILFLFTCIPEYSTLKWKLCPVIFYFMHCIPEYRTKGIEYKEDLMSSLYFQNKTEQNL